ncbi:MAG: isochorismatase family protein [Desulfohalobiaceae bacterium]
MPESQSFLQSKDCLLVVDVQNDFCPGGALPIPEGDQVVEALNPWIRSAQAQGLGTIFSRDFHPRMHPSFQDQGGPWPAHCLQDSPGAAFHPELYLPENRILVSKGVRFDRDQNSAFDQTGLQQLLQKLGVQRLIVGGLALDVCVLATVLDSLKLGLQTHVLLACTRAVSQEGARQALEQMQQAGAVLQH